MKRKKGYKVDCFKIGDVITRLKSSKWNNDFLRGDPVEFVGIFNNQIWLRTNEKNKLPLCDKDKGHNIITLNIEEWINGWNLYEHPDSVRKKEMDKKLDNYMQVNLGSTFK